MADDVQGLPDVQGLGAFVQATMTQDKAPESVPQQTAAAPPADPPQQQDTTAPQTPPNADELDLGQFKNTKDLLKSYKEIQGFVTRVSQENKELKDRFDLMQLQQQAVPPPPQQPQKSFDELFIQNPQAAIEAVVTQAVGQKLQLNAIEGVLAEESAKDESAFNERYAYAKMVAQKYPNLIRSGPAGVRKLFELGDKYRQETMRQSAMRSVNMLFGDGAIEKLAAVLGGGTQQTQPANTNLAYMPDSTMSTRSGADTGTPRVQADAVAEAVQKGDVDSVLKGIFKNALGA